MFSQAHVFWLIYTFTFLLSTCSAYSCFFPDGGTANDYTACSPTGDGSCCLDGDFCTAYGYCVSNTKGYHYRGACTDTAWGNPSCPDYCLTNENSGNSSAVNVIACDAAQTGGTWCCAYNGNCCASSSTYTPGFGLIFAEGATPTTSSGSASTPSAITKTQTAIATSVAAASSATSSSPEVSSSSHNNKTTAIVAAAVGIPLGLLALAALVFFALERSKRRRMEGGMSLEKPKPDWNISPPRPFGQLPSQRLYSPSPVYESPANERHWELGAERKPHELGT